MVGGRRPSWRSHVNKQIMNLKDMFEGCGEFRILSKESEVLLNKILNMKSVKEFDENFAKDEELDELISQKKTEEQLTPMMGRFVAKIKNIPKVSFIEKDEGFI